MVEIIKLFTAIRKEVGDPLTSAVLTIAHVLLQPPQKRTDPITALTVDEVAEVLQCGRNKVYDLIQRGDIATFSIGRMVRVSRAELDRFMNLSYDKQSSRRLRLADAA